ALDGAQGPARAFERLLHRRNGPEAEHPRLDSGDAIGDEPGDRLKATAFGPCPLRQHDRGGAAIESRCVARRDRSVGPGGRLGGGWRLHCRTGAVVLVSVEDSGTLGAGELEGNDLVLEFARRLRRGEALLRAQGPTVLRLAAHLKLPGEI